MEAAGGAAFQQGQAQPQAAAAASSATAAAAVPDEPCAAVAASILSGKKKLQDSDADALLQAVSDGDVAPYAAGGRAAAVLRGPPLEELPLHAEVALFVRHFEDSGRQQAGLVFGYSSAAAALAPWQAAQPPAGVTCNGCFGGRARPVSGSQKVLFFKNDCVLKGAVSGTEHYQVKAHVYYEAECVEGQAVLVSEISREQGKRQQQRQQQQQGEPGGAAGAGSSEGSSGDGEGSKKKQWYTYVSCAGGHGFKHGSNPTVQLAPPADNAPAAWGSPVPVHEVPDAETLVFQGKMEGKGKGGKLAEGYYVKECSRIKSGGAQMLHLHVTAAPPAAVPAPAAGLAASAGGAAGGAPAAEFAAAAELGGAAPGATSARVAAQQLHLPAAQAPAGGHGLLPLELQQQQLAGDLLAGVEEMDVEGALAGHAELPEPSLMRELLADLPATAQGTAADLGWGAAAAAQAGAAPTAGAAAHLPGPAFPQVLPGATQTTAADAAQYRELAEVLPEAGRSSAAGPSSGKRRKKRASAEVPYLEPEGLEGLRAAGSYMDEKGRLVITTGVVVKGDMLVDGKVYHKGLEAISSIFKKRVDRAISGEDALQQVALLVWRHFEYLTGGGTQAGIVAEEALAAGSALASTSPDGTPVFDQGSAIAYIGAALQALANRQDQLVQALRPALTWAAGGAPVEQLLPCAPQAAAAAAGADGRPPAARPTLSSDEAGLAAEQFDDLKLEEQVELTFQLLGSGELPLQATAGGRQPTPAEISKQKGSQRELLTKLMQELPPAAVAAALQRSRTDSMPRVLDGGQPRLQKRLGHFIKLLKSEKRAMETSIDAAGLAVETLVLRSYQQALLQRALQPGNYMIVAPTGVGKTPVAVMLACEVLLASQGGRVCFLAPTTSLVRQQTLRFMCCKQLADALEEKSRRVVMRCGGLNPADWPALLDSASVLCMTPQTLDNMFKQCAASWDQFDLLILDECHNATGRSAMASLLQRIADLPAGTPRPKVLGLTASPGAKDTLDATEEEILTLAQLMLATGDHLLNVPADDPEVARYVVRPTEITRTVIPREADLEYATRLGRTIVLLADLLHRSLPACPSHPEPAAAAADVAAGAAAAGEGGSADTDALRQPPARPPRLLPFLRSRLLEGVWMGQAEAWICETREFAEAHDLLSASQKECVQQCLELLCSCLDAMQVISTVGYEHALRSFLRDLAAFTLPVILGQPPAQPSAGAAGSDDGAATTAQAGPAGERAGDAPAGSAAGGGGKDAGGGSRGNGGDGGSAGGSDDGGGGCGTLPALPVESLLPALVDRLSREVVSLQTLNDANSPKYQALVEHLLNFAHRAALQKQAGSDSGGGAGRRSGDDGTSAGGASSEGRGADGGDGAPPACVFHGIVFARTRASVLALTQLLRQCADLDFLTVVAFMGSGSKSASCRHRGMTRSKQEEALADFKAASCGLLVATSAAEEGIDVPSCELVVRYSVAMTGKERLQSQGRARQAGGEYLTLLDAVSSDPQVEARSCQQAANQGGALGQLVQRGAAVESYCRQRE
ncbi:Hef nuclease isoform B [Micractinium conductrix]|uniref:Hef nuclease isoform B n=1 Tax=Micractinium conductrix TaxID=554055 RepID=A0A2P6VMD4_9CHLO|nr:Hef nuclease isoform B [Micractinium conductrix]|eukprot:PSC75205.1 Hef nuclease isoform B [Micractinium conductrix]